MRIGYWIAAICLLAGCGKDEEPKTETNNSQGCSVSGCESPLACDTTTEMCGPVKCDNDGDCEPLTEYCDSEGSGACRELVLYRTCALDPESPCAGEGVISCAIEDNDDCIENAKTCARYEGSQPFCTKRCNSDEDCGEGTCFEIVSGTSELHCLEPTN